MFKFTILSILNLPIDIDVSKLLAAIPLHWMDFPKSPTICECVLRTKENDLHTFYLTSGISVIFPQETFNQWEIAACIPPEQYFDCSYEFINDKGIIIRGRTNVLHPGKHEIFHLNNHPTLPRELNTQYYITFRFWNQPQTEVVMVFRSKVGTNPFLVKDDPDDSDESVKNLKVSGHWSPAAWMAIAVSGVALITVTVAIVMTIRTRMARGAHFQER
jgi:hypothetical protein